jgi:hypothetical protein
MDRRYLFASIVMNARAGLRWLDRSTPDLDEVREALRGIIIDGKRANDVIDRNPGPREEGATAEGSLGYQRSDPRGD